MLYCVTVYCLLGRCSVLWLQCTVQCCIVWQCTLCYGSAVWHGFIALYIAVLCDSVLSVMAVQCGTVSLRCTVLYCVTVYCLLGHCSVLQVLYCVTVYCLLGHCCVARLQCAACAVLCDIVLSVMAVQCGTVTVHFTVLYCVTVYCLLWQCSVARLQFAVHCCIVWHSIACYGSAVLHGYNALYSAVFCGTAYIGIWCLIFLLSYFVTSSHVLFPEVTEPTR
jgi:hypothetical protein